MFKLSELKVNSFSFFGIKKVDKISLNFDKVISIHSNLIFFFKITFTTKRTEYFVCYCCILSKGILNFCCTMGFISIAGSI